MLTWKIIAAVYATGAAADLFGLGLRGVRMTDEEGDLETGAVACVVLWPLIAASYVIASPWFAGRACRRLRERRKLAEEERRKWLEAPLP